MPPRIKLVFAMLLVMCLSSCQAPVKVFNYQQVIKTVSGESIDLVQYQRHWMLINYWASWCPSCQQEMLRLQNWFNHLEIDDNILLLGVNLDVIDWPNMSNLIDVKKISYPQTTQNPLEDVPYKPTVLPTTIIISPKGHIFEAIGLQQLQIYLDRITWELTENAN